MKSIDQPLSTTDSESTKKKEPGTEASGDQLTEPQTQKKESAFGLEATTKTPRNQNQKMSPFPPSIRWKNWTLPSQISQHSSPPTLINQRSPQINNLHPLWEQWLRLLQPRLSQAPSLNPPDLQYPLEPEPQQEAFGTALRGIFKAVQVIKERIQHQVEEAEDQEVEAILGETPIWEETLEEGEIPETPEEGEILGETQGKEIGQVIASLVENPRFSMEIAPR